MIKFSARHNLIYVILLITGHYVRKIVGMFIDSIYPFTNSMIFCLLMFLGEMCGGLLIYAYQKKAISQKKETKQLIAIKISKHYKKSKVDSKTKIYFLLVMSGFFDFIEFIILIFYISKLSYVSISLEERMCGILIIIGALMYCYLLHFPLYRHHIFSLVIMGICLVMIIMTEIFIQKEKIYKLFSDFILLIGLILLEMFFLCILDSIDKYLMEYNSVEPYMILIFEGLFGSIYTCIGFVVDNPFKTLNVIYNKISGKNFGIFIFLMFLYFALSGFTNIYRVYTIKIYTPMTESLAYYSLSPLFMIYNFIKGYDFLIQNERNYTYFLINLFLSIIITITGFIFNEFIVLFCFGLEKNTYQEITRRSSFIETDIQELNNILKEEESETDNDNKTYTIFV